MTDANFYCSIESKERSQCRIPVDPITLRYDVWTNNVSCFLPKFDECTKVFIGYSQHCDTISCQDGSRNSIIDLTKAFNLTADSAYNEGVSIIRKEEKKMTPITAIVAKPKSKKNKIFSFSHERGKGKKGKKGVIERKGKKEERKTNLHGVEHGVHGNLNVFGIHLQQLLL